MSNMCEVCRENPGATNSAIHLDENLEGLWVCEICEEEAASPCNCPCGCGGQEKFCVYYSYALNNSRIITESEKSQ